MKKNFFFRACLVAACVSFLAVSCKNDVSDSYEWVFYNETGYDVTYYATENSSLHSPMNDVLSLDYVWNGNISDKNNSHTISAEDPVLVYSYSGTPSILPQELLVVYDGKYSLMHKASDTESGFHNMCRIDDYDVEEVSLDDGSTLYRYTFTFTDEDYNYAVENGTILKGDDESDESSNNE